MYKKCNEVKFMSRSSLAYELTMNLACCLTAGVDEKTLVLIYSKDGYINPVQYAENVYEPIHNVHVNL